MTRREYDFYPTPAWCVETLLAHCPLPGGNWLEPCAGNGAIIRAVNDVRNDVNWGACELQSRFSESLAQLADPVVIGDFRKEEAHNTGLITRRLPVVIITNPPFYMAQPIVGACHRLVGALALDCPIVMLLPLGYLASQGRSRFLRHAAPDVYVLSERPSFDGSGTAPADYAWMVWRQPAQNVGRIKIV